MKNLVAPNFGVNFSEAISSIHNWKDNSWHFLGFLNSFQIWDFPFWLFTTVLLLPLLHEVHLLCSVQTDQNVCASSKGWVALTYHISLHPSLAFSPPYIMAIGSRRIYFGVTWSLQNQPNNLICRRIMHFILWWSKTYKAFVAKVLKDLTESVRNTIHHKQKSWKYEIQLKRNVQSKKKLNLCQTPHPPSLQGVFFLLNGST